MHTLGFVGIRGMMGRVIKFLRLQGKPIYEQLCLEERLLRGAGGSWCIVNDGVEDPVIVMGISAKVDEVVDRGLVAKGGAKLLRRFTGGGTVVVNKDTLFSTLIIENSLLPNVQRYPRPIMKWTEGFYSSVFGAWGNFSLQENDYAYDDLKFGGNAQSITKDKWVHHTSFLWDYEPHLMKMLKHPPKQPEYRKSRNHGEFLCRLKDYMPSRDSLFQGIKASLKAQEFIVQDVDEEEAVDHIKKNHEPVTKYVQV